MKSVSDSSDRVAFCQLILEVFNLPSSSTSINVSFVMYTTWHPESEAKRVTFSSKLESSKRLSSMSSIEADITAH